MLFTHADLERFQKKMTEILGLPTETKSNGTSQLYIWRKKNSIFECLIDKGTITIFKVILTQIYDFETQTEDEAVKLAESFIQELGK